MGYWILDAARIFLFLITFFIPFYILLPKALSLYSSWKTSGKTIYLSTSAALITGALFLIGASFVTFMKMVNGELICLR